MSDPSINADLNLSIANALTEVQRLQRALDQALSDVSLTVTADTANVPAEITSAVDRADGSFNVDADTAGVPAEISTAVDGADGSFDADADTAGVAGEITTAVDGADGSFDVDPDTAGVSGQISNAVDGADGSFDVDADTAGVTSDVSRAVDAADGSVDVDADTAAAQRQIAALEARLSDAESESAELRRELDRLGTEGQQTTQGLTVGFRDLAAVLGGVLAGAFAQSGIAFNTLQQTSRAALETLLGGAEAATQQLAELNEFADQSPFPREQFIEAQQTLIAFGVAAEDAVPTLNAIQEALAASGQSADQISEIATIFGQIQSAGRITAEELNQFAERGINAAQLIGDQFGVTAGEIREQISSGALDAETALTALRQGMETEFAGAADAVGDTFTVAQGRVRAALRDISADLFATFVDPQGGGAAVDFFNQLADELKRFQTEAGPAISALGGGLAPVLASLGSDLLPAVTTSLIELTPLLGGTTSLLQGLVPLFEVLGAGLEAVPGPVLQAVTAFGLLTRLGAASALQRIGSAAVSAGLSIGGFVQNARSAGGGLAGLRAASRGAGGAIRGLASAIGPATITTAALTLAVVELAEHQQAQAQRSADQAARVNALRTAFAEADTAADGLQLGLERLAEEGESSAQAVADTGLSAADMRGFLEEAENSADAMGTAFEAAGVRNETFIDTIREGGGPVLAYVRAQEDAERAAQDQGVAIDELSDRQSLNTLVTGEQARGIQNQINAVDEAVQQEIAFAVATETLTDEQIDQIDAAEDQTQAWFDLQGQLEAAERIQRENVEQTARQENAMGNLTDTQLREVEAAEDAAAANEVLSSALEDTSDAGAAAQAILDDYEGATGRVADQNRAVADSLNQVDAVLDAVALSADGALAPWQSLTGELERAGFNMDEVDGASGALELSLANLAVAIDAAGLSGADLEGIAADLGVTVADLEFFVGATADTINSFVSSVEGNIPTVSDALGELDDLTLTGIRDSVFDTLDAIEQFADDIDALSIRPAIQRLAIEEGPELARVMAEAQENGNDAMLDRIESGLIEIDDARQGLIEDAQVFALEFAIAMGFIAENGVEAFADEFDIESPTLDQLDRTGDALSDVAISRLDQEGAKAGRAGTDGYQRGLDLETPTTAEGDAAVEILRGKDQQLQNVGFQDGAAVTTGYTTGISPLPGETGTTMDRAVFAVAGRRGPGQSAGSRVGSGVKTGVDFGLSGVVGETGAKIDRTVFAVSGKAGIGRSAGSRVGSAIKGGTNSGMFGIVGDVRSAANSAARAAGDAKAIAFSQGSSVGADIGRGMKAGIDAQKPNVVAAAVSMARDAANSAKAELVITSPSGVFREIGEEVGDGLRLGILDEVDEVTAATEDLVRAVSDVEPPTIPVATLDPEIAGLATGQDAFRRRLTVDDPDGPDAGGVTVNVAAGAVVVNVPPGTTPAAAEQLGGRAARGFLQTLAQRRVLVDARTA